MPNIDINIKCGNSLISRYALDADIKAALKKSKWSIDSYKVAVMSYRNAQSKEEKRAMEKLIEQIKSDFESEVAANDKRVLKLGRLRAELMTLTTQTTMFEMSKAEKTKWEKDVKAKTAEIDKLEKELEEIKSNKIYENAFEWRFEFPEVLNDEGDFIGFDVVIGNPPYVDYRQIGQNVNECLKEFNTNFKSPRPNLYQYFIEQSYYILSNKGQFCFINPNQFLSIDAGFGLRKFLIENTIIQFIDDVSYIKIFEEAATYTVVWSFRKEKDGNYPVNISKCQSMEELGKTTMTVKKNDIIANGKYLIISNINQILINKIEKDKIKLGDICQMSWGTSQSGYGKKKIQKNAYEILNDSDKMQYAPIIQTRDIKRYSIQWQGEYIPKAIFSDNIINKFAITDKIVIARMTLMLQATIDSEQRFLGKSTLVYDFNKAYSIHYLLAILNSKLINFWYVNYFENTHLSGGYIRFDIPYLKKIPIPQIDVKTQSKFKKQVKQILSIKQADPKADTSALEKEIDKLVYELYGLTEEEIKIIEGE